MALPQLTPEQRSAALEKAAAARRVRAELKERLKRGGTTLKQVLVDAETDEALASARSRPAGGCGASENGSGRLCWPSSVPESAAIAARRPGIRRAPPQSQDR